LISFTDAVAETLCR